MQAKRDIAIEMEMMIDSTEHLTNLRGDSHKDQITDLDVENQSMNRKASQIDLEFQKLLCSLMESKLSENTISQVSASIQSQVLDLLKRLTGSLIMEIPKGPQIIQSLYLIILKFSLLSIVECNSEDQKVNKESEQVVVEEVELVSRIEGYPNKKGISISFIQI
ncbi:unnamed protein product (macronuclear) [Paramecium tetraurelia]|uniref:Uncharacterized protein n=1 Tax=Paramecium tetraurelia TaxID=5888 RepID=A0DHR2_PARTE|nr:uncharacterized protein GSPATT00016966001 [Paramecium tetraurelia]CAK82579.1 unnamed protein product [Paramecium tetraurelia]|eukprot:XP_001449976.1 hypothetical protein (macronuclear) [Paramecium tetraurelia strain d4-2]